MTVALGKREARFMVHGLLSISYFIMWWIYECVFVVAVLLSCPYYLNRMIRRGGYARGFLERFGWFTNEKRVRLKNLKPLWIHAVSVGEVELALQLIVEMKQSVPNLPLLLSTTTSTGHALAERRLSGKAELIYYPLDSWFCFSAVHRLVRPIGLVLVEAELWPNHLRDCAKRGIPLALVNARLSTKRRPQYRRFKWLFGAGFSGFKLVTLQSGEDAGILMELGVKPESLREIGSLKYDAVQRVDQERRQGLLSEISEFQGKPFWVAGSTHPGEESAVLDVYQHLHKEFPDLCLALAPRHVERTMEIVKELNCRNLPFVRRSEMKNGKGRGESKILLLDTTGELKYLYEWATVIFIGKSLLGRGGQNIIEPAAYSKPIIFGPHMENFEKIAQDFLNANAAFCVQDVDQLEIKTRELLNDASKRDQMGRHARDLIDHKRGGISRTVGLLLCMIKSI